MNQKILLNDASEAQLRAFAESTLGMTFPHNAKLETMRAKVAAAWNKDEIIVAVADVSEEVAKGAPPPPVTAEQQPPAPEKVRIIIQRTEEAGGDEPVPVGVNGRVMLVPRGEEVEIPLAYYEVLKTAVKHMYESLPDGGLNPIPRKITAYPFQRVA